MDKTVFLYINIHICGLCIFMFLGIYDAVVADPNKNAYNPAHYDFAILMAVINIMMVIRICYNCIQLYKKQFHKSLFQILLINIIIIFILTYVTYRIQTSTKTYVYIYVIQYIALIAFIGLIRCCECWNLWCYDRCIQSRKQIVPVEVNLPTINTWHITTLSHPSFDLC